MGLRGGFRQSLLLDSDRVVRVQFQCRTPQSARTSWNGSGGHVLPGLDPVVPEKLTPIGTQQVTLPRLSVNGRGPNVLAVRSRSIIA